VIDDEVVRMLEESRGKGVSKKDIIEIMKNVKNVNFNFIEDELDTIKMENIRKNNFYFYY